MAIQHTHKESKWIFQQLQAIFTPRDNLIVLPNRTICNHPQLLSMQRNDEREYVSKYLLALYHFIPQSNCWIHPNIAFPYTNTVISTPSTELDKHWLEHVDMVKQSLQTN